MTRSQRNFAYVLECVKIFCDRIYVREDINKGILIGLAQNELTCLITNLVKKSLQSNEYLSGPAQMCGAKSLI